MNVSKKKIRLKVALVFVAAAGTAGVVSATTRTPSASLDVVSRSSTMTRLRQATAGVQISVSAIDQPNAAEQIRDSLSSDLTLNPVSGGFWYDIDLGGHGGRTYILTSNGTTYQVHIVAEDQAALPAPSETLELAQQSVAAQEIR